MKLLRWLIILGLLVPYHGQAQVKIHFDDPNWSEEVITRPTDDVIEAAIKFYVASQPIIKKANYGTNSKNQNQYGSNCVAYVKSYLGVGGTFGNGGSHLSLNSPPAVGAVVVFKYAHVAVLTAIVGSDLIITEANYVHGVIGTRTLSVNDPTIKGFHVF